MQCSSRQITHTLWRQRWAHCWPVLPTIFLATEDHLQDIEEITAACRPHYSSPFALHMQDMLYNCRRTTQKSCMPWMRNARQSPPMAAPEVLPCRPSFMVSSAERAAALCWHSCKHGITQPAAACSQPCCGGAGGLDVPQQGAFLNKR